jgi:Holliday junction resolvasome RuvABC DNA-binding subunit
MKLEKEKLNGDQPTTENQNDESVIDIDLEDPEVEKAATLIQAGFKGVQARKQVAEMKVEKEKKTEEKLLTEPLNDTPIIDIDLEDPDVNKAATVIQSGYRGMEARKKVALMKSEKEQINEDQPSTENQNDESVIDIDLEDPEVEKAATLIQAGFRGSEARKQVAELKAES